METRTGRKKPFKKKFTMKKLPWANWKRGIWTSVMKREPKGHWGMWWGLKGLEKGPVGGGRKEGKKMFGYKGGGGGKKRTGTHRGGEKQSAKGAKKSKEKEGPRGQQTKNWGR